MQQCYMLRSRRNNNSPATGTRATGTMCYATPAVGVGWITAKHVVSLFGGSSVDEAISKEILQVAQPAAVEAAVLASQEEARRRDDVLEAQSRDLEAARYAAQREQRQYDGADPENRLVASELEQRWNQALQRVRAVETKITQHLGETGEHATAKPEEFADLANQFEIVWNDPNADVRLKKRIIRTLIHEVVADVDSAGGEIVLVIHWKGGVHTELHLPVDAEVRTAARHRNPWSEL
jgi:hypothetical protein